MVLCDVNVLVYAHRPDAKDHERYREWLEKLLSSPGPFGLSELVLSGFIRIVTNRRIFRTDPTPTKVALEFSSLLRSQPHCLIVRPGLRHWDIFAELCERTRARGNLVPDAYHAALAIESDCEWITTDRGFARFPGLRWRHPLD
ncbi:MAG: type II toxin-antitoxin system VapC family toxin [Gemmatimonadota bacterium]